MEILKFRVSLEGDLRGETAKVLPGSKNKPKVLELSGALVKSSSLDPESNRGAR